MTQAGGSPGPPGLSSSSDSGSSNALLIIAVVAALVGVVLFIPKIKNKVVPAVKRAAEAIALAEVLVDDHAVGQPEPGREAHPVRARRFAFAVAAGDHVFAEDAGAGAGAANRDAMRIARPDRLRYRRAAEDGREPQLVAAGDEDARGLLDPRHPVAFVRVAAGVEVEDVDVARAHVAEDLFVAVAGLVEPARGRDHRDLGTAAAAQLEEAAQHAAIVPLVLGSADGHDPAPLPALGDPARTHAACSPRFRPVGHLSMRPGRGRRDVQPAPASRRVAATKASSRARAAPLAMASRARTTPSPMSVAMPAAYNAAPAL